MLPGDYLKAVGIPRNASGDPEAVRWVYRAGLGAQRESVASGGHPCPSLSGQPQVPALPLGPRVLREVIGVWRVLVLFLASFTFQSEKLLQRELCFRHLPH